MPLGTLDRTPPPFFKQGPSALSKLFFFSALAVFLMVADLRFELIKPFRSALATALYPVQWLAMQPVRGASQVSTYFHTLDEAKETAAMSQKRITEMAAQALQVAQLDLENKRLRTLLELRERLASPSTAAQVLYDAADPYTRKVIIDKGLAHGVAVGSPVLDESGVLGQVTRAHPLVSEVTLLTDRDQAIPVLNTRTGVRSVAYGQSGPSGTELELRFMAGNADVQEGDLLSTSGIDGVYPPGLPVARVTHVERRAESAFARILCLPSAQINSTGHVLVLAPAGAQLPPAPKVEPPVRHRKGGRAAPGEH